MAAAAGKGLSVQGGNMQLPLKLPYDLMQTKWASILNPIIASPLNNVSILKNIKLNNGATMINHLLGRNPQGWFIVDVDGPATIYRSQPFNDLILTLTSNAQVTVSIGVF
jgi:hypothetical protein